MLSRGKKRKPFFAPIFTKMEKKNQKKGNNPPAKTKKAKEQVKILPLVIEGQTYRVPTTYKRIKSIRRYIRRGDDVRLSVPLGTKMSQIEQFCQTHGSVIFGHLTALHKRPVAYATLTVQDGDSFRCFGEYLTVKVEKGKKGEVRREGKTLLISLKNPENKEAVNRLFAAWQKETTKTYMTYLCESQFDDFKSRGIAFPEISVKAFYGKWGTCYYEVGRIVFSTALMYTSPDHARYVALHEMAHLVHGDHGKGFWELITQLMPDWKDQKAKASVLLPRSEEKGKNK